MSAFATTHWSLILAARADEQPAAAALAQICAQYRAPVLAFVKRAGFMQSDAEDLTQAFFVRFLEKRGDHAADPARGRFRQLLQVQLRHFLSDTQSAGLAQKRGPGKFACESELQHLHGTDLTPEQAFDRSFALTVIERAKHRLREQMDNPASQAIFVALAPALFEPRDQGALQVIAQAHGVRANTLAVTLKRMREKLAKLIREELANLVDDQGSLDEELRALRAALRQD